MTAIQSLWRTQVDSCHIQGISPKQLRMISYGSKELFLFKMDLLKFGKMSTLECKKRCEVAEGNRHPCSSLPAPSARMTCGGWNTCYHYLAATSMSTKKTCCWHIAIGYLWYICSHPWSFLFNGRTVVLCSRPSWPKRGIQRWVL